MVDRLQPGGGVMIWKFAPLSRSPKDQLRLLDIIDLAKIGFRRPTKSIDATTAAGRLMMQMIGGFAKFLRVTSREQMRTGHEHPRIDGRIGGCRPKLDPQQRAGIVEGVMSGRKSAAEMAPLFSVSEPTVSRVLAAARQRGNAA